MKNEVKNKINLFGKVGKIITSIIIVVLLVAEGFLLVGGVIAAVVPKDAVTVKATGVLEANVDSNYFGFEGGEISVKAGSNDIKLGRVDDSNLKTENKDGNLKINAETKDLSFNLTDALFFIIYLIVKLASILVGLYFFKALMKAFKVCDTPFSGTVVKKLSNFAISLIPCGAVYVISDSLLGSVFTGSMNLDIMSFTMPAAFVIIIFVLAMVFKYGAKLQNEYDETV